MKISIIGVGQVGATLGFTLMHDGLAEEIVLVGRDRERTRGDAADIQHANSMCDIPVVVRAGDPDETANSDVLVLTLSVKPERPDRNSLAAANRALLETTVPELAERSPQAIIVVVTNPVEAMTYHAIRLSEFPSERVIGTGTLLDSARYRAMLSAHLRVHADDLRVYVLGEHGDSQFAALSAASAGAAGIDPQSVPDDLLRRTISSGYDVFRRKGYTNFGITEATAMIIRSIVKNQRRTMPVATLINGFLGLDDVCLSIPCVIGAQGIEQQMFPSLNEAEQASLRRCADVVRQTVHAE